MNFTRDRRSRGRKDAEEEKKEEEKKAEAPASNGKLILAVTGCPTGIAHTYMAAEALEKKAKELGYRIKVETRGSGGAKNVLTKQRSQRQSALSLQQTHRFQWIVSQENR